MIHVGVAARVNPDAAERSPRVKVYTGYDHVSAKRHHLDEVMAAGPRVAAGAEKVRMQLPNEVDEHRNPKTRATVNPLLDPYLETLDVEPTTRTRYEGSSGTTCGRRSTRSHSASPMLRSFPIPEGDRGSAYGTAVS